MGSIHRAQGCAQTRHSEEIQQALSALPATALPTILMGDVNANLGWGKDERGLFPFGRDGKGLRMLDLFKPRHLCVTTPTEQQRHLPTSRPRKQGVKGNVIDMIAAARVETGPFRVCENSYGIMGTDHEMVCATVFVKGQGNQKRRFDARPRVVVAQVPAVEKINDEVLAQLAMKYTKCPPGGVQGHARG